MNTIGRYSQTFVEVITEYNTSFYNRRRVLVTMMLCGYESYAESNAVTTLE